MAIKIHSKEVFEQMQKAGELAAKTLDYIEDFVKVGVSTLELNDLCHSYIVSNNAIPAPLNYKGFPKSICTSVNHVICHGIPSAAKILKDGDIINIDVTVILNGYYGDTSRMFIVGKGRNDGIKLCQVTLEAMMLGIEAAKPGNTIRDIAIAIESHAKKYSYSVVKDFCGHGISTVFHEDPQIVHYNEKFSPYQNLQIKEGMIFTIEPMINQGTYHAIVSKIDGWTAITKDKKLSAQYEHTIGITSDGNIIFTKSPKHGLYYK
jgi:methionyl aminopeptidase